MAYRIHCDLCDKVCGENTARYKTSRVAPFAPGGRVDIEIALVAQSNEQYNKDLHLCADCFKTVVNNLQPQS